MGVWQGSEDACRKVVLWLSSSSLPAGLSVDVVGAGASAEHAPHPDDPWPGQVGGSSSSPGGGPTEVVRMEDPPGSSVGSSDRHS